ncbi:MAG: hypothetical protein IPJ88_07000 [Myxococcales bacterium]|nr:MAG: hypothetical protein IPJ88_07000 [Myxococcales bacterium]
MKLFMPFCHTVALLWLGSCTAINQSNDNEINSVNDGLNAGCLIDGVDSHYLNDALLAFDSFLKRSHYLKAPSGVQKG